MAEKPQKLKDCSCSECGRLLFKANIIHGTVQGKCKCGTLNTVSSEPKLKTPDAEFVIKTLPE